MPTPTAPMGGNGSWMIEDLREGNMKAGSKASLQHGEIEGGSRAGAEREVAPSPLITNLLMTHLAHVVEGCPLLCLILGEKTHQRILRHPKWTLHRLPSKTPWKVPIPLCCHGRSR